MNEHETLRRFRLAQAAFGESAWEIVPAVPDDDLAASGWKLAGPGRDASSLSDSERAELFALLSTRRMRMSDGQAAREAQLLSRCGFTSYLPPIDIDVCDESHTYRAFGGAERAASNALGYARKLTEAMLAMGITLVWARSNDRGGMHGEMLAPASVSDASLLYAIGDMLRKVCQDAGIPLLSRLPHKKSMRSESVYVDDSLWNRQANARGVQWRLIGSFKPGKEPKRPWSIDFDAPCARHGPYEIPLQVVSEWLAKRAARDAEVRAEKKPERRAPGGAATLSLTRAAMLQDDEVLVRSSKELEGLFYGDPSTFADQSKRLWKVMRLALDLGAADDQLVRLAWNMPGSKGAARGERYIKQTIESAKRFKSSSSKHKQAAKRIVLDRYAPSSKAEVYGPLKEWISTRLRETDDKPKTFAWMLRLLAESIKDAQETPKLADGQGMSWHVACETAWVALDETCGGHAHLDREATFKAFYMERQETDDGRKRSSWWWLQREFTLAAAWSFQTTFLGYDTAAPLAAVVDTARRTVGRTRWTVRSRQRHFIRQVLLKINPPKSATQDPDEAAWKRKSRAQASASQVDSAAGQAAPVSEADEYTVVYNMLRRPLGCRHFVSRAIAREDREEVFSGKIVCDQPLTCPACATVRFATTFEMLTDPTSPHWWGGKSSSRKLYGAWLECTTFNMAERAAKRIAKHGGGVHKIRLMSANPDTQRVVLFYVSSDQLLVSLVRSEAATLASEYNTHVTFNSKITNDGDEAALWAFNAQLGPTLCTERMLHEERRYALCDWMVWWKGRQTVVRRSKHSIPFPTREEIRSYVRGDADADIDLDNVLWQTIHHDTSFVLHEGERRPTIDAALWYANAHHTFKYVHEEHEKEAGIPDVPAKPSLRNWNRVEVPDFRIAGGRHEVYSTKESRAIRCLF